MKIPLFQAPVRTKSRPFLFGWPHASKEGSLDRVLMAAVALDGGLWRRRWWRQRPNNGGGSPTTGMTTSWCQGCDLVRLGSIFTLVMTTTTIWFLLSLDWVALCQWRNISGMVLRRVKRLSKRGYDFPWRRELVSESEWASIQERGSYGRVREWVTVP